MRPPGRTTRTISATTAAGSAASCSADTHNAWSNAALANGSGRLKFSRRTAACSAVQAATVVRACVLHHARRGIKPDDPETALGEHDHPFAGAAGKFQHPFVGAPSPTLDQLDQASIPSAVGGLDGTSLLRSSEHLPQRRLEAPREADRPRSASTQRPTPAARPPIGASRAGAAGRSLANLAAARGR